MKSVPRPNSVISRSTVPQKDCHPKFQLGSSDSSISLNDLLKIFDMEETILTPVQWILKACTNIYFTEYIDIQILVSLHLDSHFINDLAI